MVREVVVLTLGFDTRFQMKTLARLGPGGAAKVVIVRPEGPDEKADRAEEELARFAADILGLEVEVVRVGVDRPAEAVATIAARLGRYAGYRFTADLSGGMRALILETLAGLLRIASGDALRITVWTEDLKSRVELSPLLFKLPSVDDVSLEILERLGRGVPLTLKELAEALGRPRSTVFVKLKRLAGQGLVRRYKDESGRVLYEATQAGLAALLAERGVEG